MYKKEIVANAHKIIEIITIIDNIKDNIEIEEDFEKVLFLKQEMTSQYLLLQNLFIEKEKIIHRVKEDLESHIFLLKDRYFDNLSLGYWEYLFNIHSKIDSD